MIKMMSNPISQIFKCGYSTVWKFSNFPATLILREINFGWFQKVKNCHFNNFGGFEFWFFEKLHTLKCQKIPKIQNSELLKWSNWQFLRLQNDQNSFQVNSKVTQSEFSIRLPRSVSQIYLDSSYVKVWTLVI